MMRKLISVVALSIVSMFAADASGGYDVVKVKDGATIKGTVSFTGTVPPDDVIVIDENADYCGMKQPAGRYVISDSKVKNAVIWIEGLRKGKAVPHMPVPVIISKCRAVPHVSIGFVGGEFVFRNDDDILHTVQSKLGLAYQKEVSARPLMDGASIYNLALPEKGHEVRKPIKYWHRYTEETGFIQIRSNTHNWIRGYIFIFDHPYAAVTDAGGTFAMNDIPPGEYTLKAWHEGFGMRGQTIKVRPGDVLEVNIDFNK